MGCCEPSRDQKIEKTVEEKAGRTDVTCLLTALSCLSYRCSKSKGEDDSITIRLGRGQAYYGMKYLDTGIEKLKVHSCNIDMVSLIDITKKRIYLAFRGTKVTNPKDIFNDVMIAVGMAPYRVKSAEAFSEAVVKDYPDYAVYTTGHSLGGRIAEEVSAKSGWMCESFNGAFVWPSFFKKEYSNILAHVVSGDVIAWGTHLGPKRVIKKNSKNAHTLENFLNELKQRRDDEPLAERSIKPTPIETPYFVDDDELIIESKRRPKVKKCSACCRPITGKNNIKRKKRVYHRECMKCHYCKKEITGNCTSLDNMLIHYECVSKSEADCKNKGEKVSVMPSECRDAIYADAKKMKVELASFGEITEENSDEMMQKYKTVVDAHREKILKIMNQYGVDPNSHYEVPVDVEIEENAG